MTKLSIIIPAYNEEKTIHLILNKIKDVNLVWWMKKEIIVINDYSSDDTSWAVKRYISSNTEMNIQFFEHVENKWKW